MARCIGDLADSPNGLIGTQVTRSLIQGAAASPHGQLVFFAEFLAATGVFERRVSACPLAYKGSNAQDKREVLGARIWGCWRDTGAMSTSPRCVGHLKALTSRRARSGCAQR
jgi:hypothetical protein